MPLKKYLQLTRAHTVPLEAVPAAVGALAATGGQFGLGVVAWTVYGALYHLSGYGMNSLTDWVSGEDKRDPNKEHHPLNSGVLTKRKAEFTVYSLLIVTAALGIVLISAGSNRLAGITILIIAVLSGSLYNIADVEMEYKVNFICAAHSSVFLIPYISLGGDSIIHATLGVVMVWMWVFFQIGVSGEIKDLATDDSNILRDRFGCNVSGEYSEITPEAYTFSVGMRLAMIAVFGWTAWYITGLGAALVVMILGVVSTNEARSMMMKAAFSFNRDQALLSMSIIEVLTLTMFVFSFTGVLTVEVSVYLLIAAGVWVMTFNQIEWGTVVAPEV